MKEKRFFCPDTHFLVAYCFYDDFEVPYLNRQEKKRRVYEIKKVKIIKKKTK